MMFLLLLLDLDSPDDDDLFHLSFLDQPHPVPPPVLNDEEVAASSDVGVRGVITVVELVLLVFVEGGEVGEVDSVTVRRESKRSQLWSSSLRVLGYV